MCHRLPSLLSAALLLAATSAAAAQDAANAQTAQAPVQAAQA